MPTVDQEMLEEVYEKAQAFLDQCPGCAGLLPPSDPQSCVCWPLRKAVRDLGAWRIVRASGPRRDP